MALALGIASIALVLAGFLTPEHPDRRVLWARVAAVAVGTVLTFVMIAHANAMLLSAALFFWLLAAWIAGVAHHDARHQGHLRGGIQSGAWYLIVGLAALGVGFVIYDWKFAAAWASLFKGVHWGA